MKKLTFLSGNALARTNGFSGLRMLMAHAKWLKFRSGNVRDRIEAGDQDRSRNIAMMVPIQDNMKFT
jgi:hypothetical protein